MIDQKAPQTNLFAQLMQCILHAIENPPHALASIGMPRLQMGVMLLSLRVFMHNGHARVQSGMFRMDSSANA